MFWSRPAMSRSAPRSYRSSSAHLPYAKNDVKLDAVFPIGSKELLTRGLSGIVKSRKNPLDREFEKTLNETFVSFYGLVVPHQPTTGK